MVNRKYFIGKSISATRTDGENSFDFHSIFDGDDATFLRITNDDSTYSLYVLFDDLGCYPTASDYEVKAGESHPFNYDDFACSSIRMVAATQAIDVRISAAVKA